MLRRRGRSKNASTSLFPEPPEPTTQARLVRAGGFRSKLKADQRGMMSEVLAHLEAAADEAQAYASAARAAVKPRVWSGGKLDRGSADREQHLVHGLAWVATYAETLREVSDWAKALSGRGQFGEIEELLAR